MFLCSGAAMLNPRAYRAALLEQLTSAAAAPPPPLESHKDAVPSVKHDKEGSDARSSFDKHGQPSRLWLPRAPAPCCDSTDTTSFMARDACVVEDSVVRQGHLSAGKAQLVGQESNRSLILSFIDNCLRSGVPEEIIAEQVQFMVASMHESLAMHAAMHAQRQKERVREYELGALTNMVERQQLQLTQQQQQEYPKYSLPAAAPVALQLAPPPPLVYAAPPSHDRYSLSSAHHEQEPMSTHTFPTSHSTVYPASATRVVPQRRAPSPQPSPFSHDVSPHSPVPAAARSQPSKANDDENRQPSVLRTSSAQAPSSRSVKEARARNAKETKHSRCSSTRSPSVETSGIKDGNGVAVLKPHCTAQHRHRDTRYHHRDHRALCDVCLRVATENEGTSAEAAKSPPSPPLHPRQKKKSTASKAALATAAAAAAATTTTPTPVRRSSLTAYRQQYQPNGHYMKPTHASLVRRASSTSQPQLDRSPSRNTSSGVLSGAPPQRESAANVSAALRPPRRLLVRSTYSSRLRAATSRPPSSPDDFRRTSDQSRAEQEDDDDSGNGSDSDSEQSRTGVAAHTRDAGSSASDAGNSSRVSAEEEVVKVDKHRMRTKERLHRRSDTKRSWRGKEVVDLFSSSVDTSSRSSARSRTATAAQTDSEWLSTRPAVATTAVSAPSHTAWKLSIDPEPHSSLSEQQHGSANITTNATALQWQQTLASAPASEASSAPPPPPSPQQQQNTEETVKETRRPHRDPPSRPPLSSTPALSPNSNTPRKLLSESKENEASPEKHAVDEARSLVPAPAPVMVMSADDGEDDKSVCVTSPELQLFLETSQRKVRETERLLARSAHVSSPITATAAASVQSSPARVSTIHLPPQPHWKECSDQPPSLSYQEVGWSSRVVPSPSPPPQHRDAQTLRWAGRVRMSPARAKQQQRLQELRDRLREYDTPRKLEKDGQSAVNHLSEASTFASATASSSSTTPSQFLRFRFQPHYAVQYPSSLENSPLIQISPTSSDEDRDEA